MQLYPPMNRWLVPFLAAVTYAGCALPDDPETEVGTVSQEIACPSDFCGKNSPTIMNHSFWELSLQHLTNDQGFSFTTFQKNGLEYTLQVTNGVITGYRRGYPMLAGQALVGSEIGLKWTGGGTYALVITGVVSSPFWASASPTAHPLIETYGMKWQELHGGIKGPLVDLCGNDKAYDALLGMNAHATLVFEGERFNADSKTIIGVDNSYFNFGCAGSALAKMQLTGHTQAAKAYGFTTSIAERQTMLKMLTADYCGTGKAFTAPGEPLHWADDKGWMQVNATDTLEARWNEKGAICLGKPRLVANPNWMWKDPSGEPDVQVAIDNECKLANGATLPPCADGSLTPSPQHLISANY